MEATFSQILAEFILRAPYAFIGRPELPSMVEKKRCLPDQCLQPLRQATVERSIERLDLCDRTQVGWRGGEWSSVLYLPADTCQHIRKRELAHIELIQECSSCLL